MPCKVLFQITLAFFFSIACFSQKLQVSDNNRYLVMENNEPFFYMADTAWELFHRTTREQVDMYLSKAKGTRF